MHCSTRQPHSGDLFAIPETKSVGCADGNENLVRRWWHDLFMPEQIEGKCPIGSMDSFLASSEDVVKAITGFAEGPVVALVVSAAISRKASTPKRTLVTTYRKAFGLLALNSLSEDQRMQAAAAFGGGVDLSSSAGVVFGAWRSNT